jgi:dynactin complex subunit
MSEQQKPENDLRDEFRNLGENLKQVFNSAWESDERKKLQQDIKDGMKELGFVLEGFAEDVRSSDVGETIRREANEFGDFIRSGEVEEKTRQGIVNALQALNSELQKAADKFSGTVEVEVESAADSPAEDSDA